MKKLVNLKKKGIILGDVIPLVAKHHNAHHSTRRDYPINFKVLTIIVFIFLVADILILLLPFYFNQPTDTFMMELRNTYLASDGSYILLNYTLKKLLLVSIASCILSYSEMKLNCSGKINGTEIIVFVNRFIYSYMYRTSNSSLVYLNLSINITLDKGFDTWTGSYPVNWKPLEVYSFNNGTVKVHNPNYIPFNLTNVQVYHYKSIYELPTITTLGNFTIDPNSTIILQADNLNGTTYIRFYYNYKFAPGGVVYESRQVSP
ncbi:MAG TPA: hypothetical protein VKU94_07300 [Geobacterales bacterium]|nr:hypothetical protein [Geobacterales bacterium]